VLAVDMNGAAAAETSELCPSGSCHACVADITLEASWRKVLQTTCGLFDNCLDVVVNCAGVIHDAVPSHELPEDQYDRVFKVNVKPLYLSTRVIVPWLKENKRPGLFINLSSTSEPRPRPFFVWYAASKGAVTTVSLWMPGTYPAVPLDL
jgi:3-oxoacyl-[acyl-carrier protein] reductase